MFILNYLVGSENKQNIIEQETIEESFVNVEEPTEQQPEQETEQPAVQETEQQPEQQTEQQPEQQPEQQTVQETEKLEPELELAKHIVKEYMKKYYQKLSEVNNNKQPEEEILYKPTQKTKTPTEQEMTREFQNENNDDVYECDCELKPEKDDDEYSFDDSLNDILDDFYFQEELLDNIINNVNEKIRAFDNKFHDALNKLNKITENFCIDNKRKIKKAEEKSKKQQFQKDVKEQKSDILSFSDKILEATFKNRKYGFVRSTKKHTFAIFDQVCHDNIQISVDLREYFPTVYDQGRLGSCTANAIAGAFNYYVLITKNEKFNASRLFIYYNERVKEHTVNWDSGATIEDGVSSIGKVGVCSEQDWPYEIKHFRQKPSISAFNSAKEHMTDDYAPVEVSVMSFKLALSNGFPVIFGFNVYESFETLELAKSGIMVIPDITQEKLLGGHAILACGFDDNMEHNGHKGYLLCRNSWGSSWGIDGYFWMPYDFINDTNCADCWIFGGYNKDLDLLTDSDTISCTSEESIITV